MARFTAVYNVMSKAKRNASSSTHYKDAPKTVTTPLEATVWYYDHVHNRGMNSKRLVEIRQH